MSLKYRVIAITGAGSGIGRALVKQCLAQGAYVAAADISRESLDSLAAELSVPELSFMTTVLDVADTQAVTAWAKSVVEYFGYVDAVINNAGVSLSCSALTMPRDQMVWSFNINFWGVVNGCDAFLPYLQQQPRAHIVNISSLFGLLAVPSQAAYNAAKFAVRGYSEALRQDLAGTRVRVTTVHPGGVRTNIVRNGRHYESVTGEITTTEETAELFERMARTTPEQAAAAIIRGMRKGKPRVLIGADARVLDWLQRLMPARYDRLLRLLLRVGKKRAPQTTNHAQ